MSAEPVRVKAPRGDTRERIQSVALELFAEHGYEKTSLREIAERLDVTKAALYYHFKSKEDIVRSFTEDYVTDLDALIAWGAAQPPTEETRGLLLDRYSRIVGHRLGVMRFLEQNQAAVHQLMSRGPAGPQEAVPDPVRDACAICWPGRTPRCGTGSGRRWPWSRWASRACCSRRTPAPRANCTTSSSRRPASWPGSSLRWLSRPRVSARNRVHQRQHPVGQRAWPARSPWRPAPPRPRPRSRR